MRKPTPIQLTRRAFLATAAASASAAESVNIAHRQASMLTEGPAVFELAKRIKGLNGVEIQVHRGPENLWHKPTLTAYRNAAKATGLAIPSIAGIWPKGATLMQPTASDPILRSIEVAHELGAKVILIAAFKANIPNMTDASSYAPVVTMLQNVAPTAKQANVTLGLETSLSPEHDKKLIDLVNHPNVRVYLDANNTEFYGHTGQSITAIDTLGRERICQVHAKNEHRLLEETGRVDWAAFLKRLRSSGYNGWITFETQHSSPEQCVTATERNIAFVRRCWASIQ